MRTHTPRSKYASLTKGLVVGFWGLSCFFSGTTRRGRFFGVGVQTVIAKLHAGVFFFLRSFLSCSLPFISSQLSTTPNCIAGNPTALKRTGSMEKGEGKGPASVRGGRQHHPSISETKNLVFFFLLWPLQTGSPGIFNPPYTRSVLQV